MVQKGQTGLSDDAASFHGYCRFFFFLYYFFGLLWLYWYYNWRYDRKRGEREREGVSDTQQRDPGQESKLGPLQSLSTWDARYTNWLCPCTVHGGSPPPVSGRRSSASIWHAPSVSQQREVLVFPWFWDQIWIFQVWLSGQWHTFLWYDKLITQMYFCFTRTLSQVTLFS